MSGLGMTQPIRDLLTTERHQLAGGVFGDRPVLKAQIRGQCLDAPDVRVGVRVELLGEISGLLRVEMVELDGASHLQAPGRRPAAIGAVGQPRPLVLFVHLCPYVLAVLQALRRLSAAR